MTSQSNNILPRPPILKIIYWELTYWPKAFALLAMGGFKYHHPNQTYAYYFKLICKRQCRLQWLRKY